MVGDGDDVGGVDRWVPNWVSYVEDMVNRYLFEAEMPI